MTVPRIVGLVALIASVTACGSGTLILWNPKTGECDAVPKAAAYALGGSSSPRLRTSISGVARG
jgi:hypothetical protein